MRVVRVRPVEAETFLRDRAVRVRERARDARGPDSSLRDQLPAYMDAIWQANLESVLIGARRDRVEYAMAVEKARTVASHLDDVATALANAQVMDDEDLRREEIFRANRALIEAETAF